MKRLSLLKKIALGSGAVAAVTPIALMATSCAIEDVYAEFIDFDTILQNYEYKNPSKGLVSYKKLLFGSKKVMSGNYVLFVGSNTYDNTCLFYSGNSKIRDREQWFTLTPSGYFNVSPFFYGIQKAAGESYNNFGIYNVIDFFDFKFYDKTGHQIYIADKQDHQISVVSPLQKWTNDIISCTKNFNNSEYAPEKYEWDEKSVTTDEYIRNDDSAVRFRAFLETAAKVYPTNDKRKKTFTMTDSKGYMLVFKDGQLQKISGDEDIGDMPTTMESWYEIVKKFKKESTN